MQLPRLTLLTAALAVVALPFAIPSSAKAADPVGYVEPVPYKHVVRHKAYRHHAVRHHHRHHPRRIVVAQWTGLECGLLKVTDWQGTRFVKVCHPPVF
ncbi:hypothetical protein BJF93_09880 [Xaviernesmea oryzae]|uniref:Secreted protein n=1 Tax=Xaviernesmea oryzae TaxID=464029 RepID=A0A1Q9AWR4_9HYPH|nr:hypothetical protein [Xaviernesmea oryzae]OLP59902.1 hypothetical protein BJF93_09880 [Xaviernesmea oryzae]SEK46228.1 hypothetical protein SAMN04487976_102239 [Xaviernesmea oryzae]